MDGNDFEFSRISKLFVDRDQADPDAILARRQRFKTTLLCGKDVARSYALQLAVLTAARIGVRCFPGAVGAVMPPELADAPLLARAGSGLTFGGAVIEVLGSISFCDDSDASTGTRLLFGDA